MPPLQHGQKATLSQKAADGSMRLDYGTRAEGTLPASTFQGHTCAVLLDTQLALMAMACSHLVIVNHKGELSRQLQDLLEVCLFALKHLQVPHARAVRKPRRDCLTDALFGTHLGQ